jgi:hypothetical protein
VADGVAQLLDQLGGQGLAPGAVEEDRDLHAAAKRRLMRQFP